MEGGGGAEGEASGGVPLDSRLAADRVGDGVVGRGDLGADGVEMGVAAGAVDSGLAANGMRSMAATQEAEGGVGGSGGDGGFDNNESEVTDEAKIDEGAVGAQEIVNQEVMADLGSDSGLDKNGSAVTNEPNFGRTRLRCKRLWIKKLWRIRGVIWDLTRGKTKPISSKFPPERRELNIARMRA